MSEKKSHVFSMGLDESGVPLWPAESPQGEERREIHCALRGFLPGTSDEHDIQFDIACRKKGYL